MNDRDLAGKTGQVNRFLDGGVPAADHGNLLIAEEGAVAGGAVGNPLAGQFTFPRHSKLSGPNAGSQDNRPAGQGGVVDQGNYLLRSGQIQPLDLGAGTDLQLETPGLGGHFLDQFTSGYSFGKTGIVVDPVGIQHLAAGHALFQQYRL